MDTKYRFQPAMANSLADKFANLQRATTELNDALIQLKTAEKNFSEAQTEYQRREGEQPRRKELEQQIHDLEKIHETLTELENKNAAAANNKNFVLFIMISRVVCQKGKLQ